MRKELSNEEILGAVESAFRPLRCVAEVWDYEQKLRFKVFDGADRGVVEVRDLGLRHLRDKSNLKSVLSSARAMVEEKGFHLEPLVL